jgi:hypothetical protein
MGRRARHRRISRFALRGRVPSLLARFAPPMLMALLTRAGRDAPRQPVRVTAHNLLPLDLPSVTRAAIIRRVMKQRYRSGGAPVRLGARMAPTTPTPSFIGACVPTVRGACSVHGLSATASRPRFLDRQNSNIVGPLGPTRAASSVRATGAYPLPLDARKGDVLA